MNIYIPRHIDYNSHDLENKNYWTVITEFYASQRHLYLALMYVNFSNELKEREGRKRVQIICWLN